MAMLDETWRHYERWKQATYWQRGPAKN